MENGGKGQGQLQRGALSWPGSRPHRPTAPASHPLGMEASGNSRGAPRFRVRRYVRKAPPPIGGPLQEGDKATRTYLCSIKNRFGKTRDRRQPVAAAPGGERLLKIPIKM